MALPLEQFVSRLDESGLMSADDVQAFVESLPEDQQPPDSQQLARLLVRAKKLTAYQAQEVYKGAGKGLVLGNYVILDKLGQGGMGLVLKAEHKRMKRLVALKVLSPAVTKTPEALARFQREVEAAAKLRHSNIVAADDADEAGGVHFLVMEYVEGTDLSALVKKAGPLPVDKALHCILQAARGLEYAHQEGVIHRDIKPANMLLDNKGTVKILDMGLARFESSAGGGGQADLTGTGQIMGTVDYMAPEQAMNTKHADQRADIYSLGISLWYLVTGRAAYDGETLMEKLMAHQTKPIPSLRDACPQASPVLEGVFTMMVAKTPESRYQSMTEVLADLERCRTGEGSAPSLASAPGDDSRMSDFLRGMDYTLAPAVATKVAPKTTAVSPADEATMVRQAAQVDTDPHTETSLPKIITAPQAGASAQRKQASRPPWWRQKTAWIAAGGGGALVLLLAAVVIFVQTRPGQRPVAGGDKVTVQVKSPGALANGGRKPPVDAGESAGWHGWPKDAPTPAIAPFDAATAKKYQVAWAKYLKVDVEYTNSLGMKFVLIPPGEFMMGSTPAEIDQALKLIDPNDKLRHEYVKSESPQHRVILTQPIYLGVHEVTQADYKQVMGKNPSYFATTGPDKAWVEKVAGMDTTIHPVEGVSWNDAAEFCAKLSQQETLKPFYRRAGETVTPLDGTGYRLPSEAEWEFACRAGTTTKYWIGDTDEELLRAGWFVTNSGGRTHAVGKLEPNPFRLYDIHGNVWEWVQDRWEPTYYGQFQERAAINPDGPFSAGSQRVIRGGSLRNNASLFCRASSRDVVDPSSRTYNLGFRVSLVVDAVKAAIAEGKTKSASATTGWHGWPKDAPPPAIAPFDAATAERHQEAWAKYLKIDMEFTNSIGMKFRLIPPGEFTMGSTPAEIEAALKVRGEGRWQECIQSEAPHHQVVLTQPIYLGVHEVTQGQYEQVLAMNPSHFAPIGAGKDAVAGMDTSSHPVEMVSWNDAAEFCSKLSQREKLKPYYLRAGETVTTLDDAGYRLPTEAQWEFACRAGTTTKYWNGDKDQDLPQAGWFGGNSGSRTHAIGELKKNPFGLYDIHGNVWEWVQDWWEPTYYGQFQEKPALDPNGSSSAGSWRVIRGGCWNTHPSACRASDRNAPVPPYYDHSVGFRVSLPVDAVKAAIAESNTQPAGATDILFSPDYEWTEPVNLGPPVNTKSAEMGPCISADGLSLWFHRNGGTQGGYDIWTATRPSLDKPLGDPVCLGAEVNSPAVDGSPTVTADGCLLIFTSERPGGNGKSDLWMCRRDAADKPWEPAIVLAGAVNSPDGDFMPHVSSDGLTLVFASDRSGGKGQADLYQARRGSLGEPFGKPVNLGANVNSASGEQYPALSSDGLVLLFGRWCGDDGSWDMFLTRCESAGAEFELAAKIGAPVNSPVGEGQPSLSSDNRTLYFESNRPGALGDFDIWMTRRMRK